MTEQPWTPEADRKLRAYLARPGYKIPTGIGTEEAACSMAAINLALTGELSGDVPPCMSEVVGEWIIVVQDRMPAEIRDSMEWRALLPLAAGTGRDKEKERERCEVILNWMWGTVLPYLQPIADADGYGPAWRAMCMARTEEAANTAREAASEAARATDYAASYAASAAASAAARTAGYTASAAAYTAAHAADYAASSAAASEAARAAERATAKAESATASPERYAAASNAAWEAGYAAAHAAAWAVFDPVGVLRQLVDVH